MDDPPTVSYNAWPGMRVEPPPVLVEQCERDGEWIVYDTSGRTGTSLRPVPDQVALFEMTDLDDDDLDVVAALSPRFGRFTHINRIHEDLPPNAEIAILRAVAVRGQDYDPSQPPEDSYHRVHVAEIAYRIRVLRHLARHVAAVGLGTPLTEAWAGPGNRPVRSDHHAWDNFLSYANPALLPFHVRVWVGKWGEYDSWPTVYEVAVLQLINDLATNADFHICANETCRRPFVRQRDRSRYHSRTIGVLYCTRSCATSQAQREYRRRQRARKGS